MYMYHFEKQVDTFQNFHANLYRWKYQKICLRQTSDGPMMDAGANAPLTIAALLPVALYLILGVASMAYVSVQYLNKTCMLFVGS